MVVARTQQAVKLVCVLCVCEEEEFTRNEHVKTQRLILNPRRNAHFDETITILGSEEDSEIQAVARVVEREQRRARVQEDSRALTPHLAALRHMLEGEDEEEEGTGGSGGSAGEASAVEVLMDELDERRPQAPGSTVGKDQRGVQTNGVLETVLLELRVSA